MMLLSVALFLACGPSYRTIVTYDGDAEGDLYVVVEGASFASVEFTAWSQLSDGALTSGYWDGSWNGGDGGERAEPVTARAWLDVGGEGGEACGDAFDAAACAAEPEDPSAVLEDTLGATGLFTFELPLADP